MAPEASSTHGDGDLKVVLVDVGAKDGIVECLVRRGARVVRVPWHQDFLADARDADGVIIGNGPGDPQDLDAVVQRLRTLIGSFGGPIFGVCLGHQLLARAAGFETYKLRYGHRGSNQPVREVQSGRCYVTSQNHGYAVDQTRCPSDWEPWFVNLNDGTNEGIRMTGRPVFSVQFHPEGRPGPTDTEFLFDEFLALAGSLKSRQSLMTTIQNVLLLGSGPLQIGQAGEFDYSGSQALKALREAGVRSVLVNPNIATVQTSNDLADRVYLAPVTPEFVEKIAIREQVDGILLAFGGQTALNCGLALHDSGVLDRLGIRVLGTPVAAIRDTEDGVGSSSGSTRSASRRHAVSLATRSRRRARPP